MELTCFNCDKKYQLENVLNMPRSEECPHCYASTRCCRMCQFYDKSSYNECKEPTSERIVEKEKSNFCDFYRLIDLDGSFNASVNDIFSAADNLFKK